MNHPALSPCILLVCFSASPCDKEQSTHSRQTNIRVHQEKLNPYSGQVDCLHTAPYRPTIDGMCHAPTYRMTLTQKALTCCQNTRPFGKCRRRAFSVPDSPGGAGEKRGAKEAGLCSNELARRKLGSKADLLELKALCKNRASPVCEERSHLRVQS